MSGRWALAAVIAFGVGFGCRWFSVPTPAPTMLSGALLVVAMTLGAMAADRLLTPRDAVGVAAAGERSK